jgi:hypothetical protein
VARSRRTVAPGPLLALLGAGLAVVATAMPALAAQDPARPRATVTRGPSCAPGGLELQVQAGTVAVHVVLATTRSPEGEDATDLAAGATGVLHTHDVDWGESIDSRLVSTPADGSGETWLDELDDWTLTRPTEADCAIATGTPSVAPATGTAPGPVAGTERVPADPTAGAPAPVPADPGTTVEPAGTAPAGPSAVVTEGAAGSDGAASRAVGAGRPITVTGRGFRPGEPVTVRVAGSGDVLARGTAGADGTVALRLTVPARAAGATGMDLTGGASGTAVRLQLQVAALRLPATAAPAEDGGTPGLPPLAALVSLTATGGALVPVARRSAALRRGDRLPGRR